jgi:hypothetical protein
MKAQKLILLIMLAGLLIDAYRLHLDIQSGNLKA